MSHLVATPYLALLVFPFFSWRGLSFDAPFPSVHVAIMQILVSMIVEDALFYWAHRGLHHPLIYKHIHKQHHLYKNTVSYAAEFANPIEQTLANVIPTYAGPLLCGMNMNMLCVW